MHAILSYRGNRPTHTQTHPPTHRQDRLQYTAPQLARSVLMEDARLEMTDRFSIQYRSFFSHAFRSVGCG